MEEMNADNRRVDAAVASLRSKAEFVKLKRIAPMNGGIPQIDLMVSDVDFTQWQMVLLDVNLTVESYVRVNQSTQGYYSLAGSTGGNSGGSAYAYKRARLVFMPMLGLGDIVNIFSFGRNFSVGSNEYVKYSELTSINMLTINGANYLAGCELTLWGVR